MTDLDIMPPEHQDRMTELVREHGRRRVDALRLYRPMPEQLRFHLSNASERIIRGGNRCLGGEQEIYDPVEGRTRRVDLIDREFHVMSRNPKSGATEVCRASRPFVKGFDNLYRVSLSTGESLVAALGHHVLTSTGTWISVRDAIATGASLLRHAASVECRTLEASSKQSLVRTASGSKVEESTCDGKETEAFSLKAVCVSRGPLADHPDEREFRIPLTGETRRFRNIHERLQSALQSSFCSDRGHGVACRKSEASSFDSKDAEDFSGLSLTSSGVSLNGCFEDGPHLFEKAPGFLGCYLMDHHLCDERLRFQEDISQALFPLLNDAHEHTPCSLPVGGSARSGVCSRFCQWLARPSNPDVCRLTSDRFFGLAHQIFSIFCKQFERLCQTFLRSDPRSFVGQHTADKEFFGQEFFASHPRKFHVGNNEKSCHITKCESIRQGLVWDFTVEPFANYVAAGLVSANSGKSVAGFAEIASAATGIPIIGPDEKPLPMKYSTNRPLRIWCIGYDQIHIGETIYRMLFELDAFRVIQCPETDKVRAWNPLDPEDRKREHLAQFAGPLIPHRMIESIAWENKGQHIFSVVRLHSRWKNYEQGTEIHAYSSRGAPKQGDPVDVIHVDEDVEYPNFLPEWQARLADRKGRFIWTAFPHSKNHALINLSERAEQQAGRENPEIEEFRLRFSANPYIDANEKEKMLERWSAFGPEVLAARDEGEFQTERVMIYPMFSEDIHGLPKRKASEENEMEAILRENKGQIPPDWCRYLALDPGTQLAAVLFAAVPPESFGDYVVCYDELYLRQCDAEQLADKVLQKVEGQYFEAFLIDNRSSRRKPEGFSKTVREQYVGAFERRGIRCRLTGSGFMPGSDDLTAGITLVRSAMRIRGDGTTRLKVWLPGCRNLVKELLHYKNSLGRNDEVLEKPASGQRDHLCDALRYLISFNPRYIQPNLQALHKSPAYVDFENRRRLRDSRTNRDTAVHAGPGALAVPV